jgi:hypothetical protein
MSVDEDRFLKMQRDAENAPRYFATVKIVVNFDGTMGMDGPFGDKELFLKILEQATDCVKANAKDRGTLLVPAEYGDAKARPEGYF